GTDKVPDGKGHSGKGSPLHGEDQSGPQLGHIDSQGGKTIGGRLPLPDHLPQKIPGRPRLVLFIETAGGIRVDSNGGGRDQTFHLGSPQPFQSIGQAFQGLDPAPQDLFAPQGGPSLGDGGAGQVDDGLYLLKAVQIYFPFGRIP